MLYQMSSHMAQVKRIAIVVIFVLYGMMALCFEWRGSQATIRIALTMALAATVFVVATCERRNMVHLTFSAIVHWSLALVALFATFQWISELSHSCAYVLQVKYGHTWLIPDAVGIYRIVCLVAIWPTSLGIGLGLLAVSGLLRIRQLSTNSDTIASAFICAVSLCQLWSYAYLR
jgi:hypothetical protein